MQYSGWQEQSLCSRLRRTILNKIRSIGTLGLNAATFKGFPAVQADFASQALVELRGNTVPITDSSPLLALVSQIYTEQQGLQERPVTADVKRRTPASILQDSDSRLMLVSPQIRTIT